MSLSMKTRLECPHSYATSESMHLLCEYAGVCDGKLYDCCLYDCSYNRQMELIAEDKEPEVEGR